MENLCSAAEGILERKSVSMTVIAALQEFGVCFPAYGQSGTYKYVITAIKNNQVLKNTCKYVEAGEKELEKNPKKNACAFRQLVVQLGNRFLKPKEEP